MSLAVGFVTYTAGYMGRGGGMIIRVKGYGKWCAVPMVNAPANCNGGRGGG